MNNQLFKYGFSLVELLSSIAILTIIVIFAIPQFEYILARMESKKVLSTLETNLRNSKYHAYIHHQRVVVCGSKEGQICNHAEWSDGLLIFNDSTPNRLKDHNESIIQHIQLNLKHGTLQWRGFGVSGNILFASDTGLPRGSNGSFEYCSKFPENHRQMTLSSMGHTNIKKIITC